MATSTASVRPPSLAHYVGDCGISDFTLRINGAAFPVLSGLMKMRSRAMHDLCESGAVEMETREWCIDLPGVSEDVVRQLLEHCYGDPLFLSADRLQQLWTVSRYLQLDHLPELLAKEAPALLPTSSALISAEIVAPELIAAAAGTLDIHPADAGKCLELALHAGCTQLTERAAAIAATQLTEVELSELPAAALLSVLQTSMLQHGEDAVLEAVAKVAERESLDTEMRSELLHGVRFELLSNAGLLRARELGVSDSVLFSAALRYRDCTDRPRALPANPAAAVVAALSTIACSFGLPRKRDLLTSVQPRQCPRPDSNWGIAFNVRAKFDSAISALHCARGDDDPCAVRIFTCCGNYADCAEEPQKWKQVTKAATELEKRTPTRVPVEETVVRAGSTQGFLILSTQFAARMLVAKASECAPCADEFMEILPGSVHQAPAERPGVIAIRSEAEQYCFVGCVEYLAFPPPPPGKNTTASTEVEQQVTWCEDDGW
eukprot:TRINITY_DN6245_c0_g1_i1.p1 TRINITY_DN6245_c0_g1~~TRINITY_DN6245_c0_g1_i1.p1  ORF type:complete len:508 (+),score=195.56 TRINITY_DN6245_c0_g1_i1:54-1526(+)